MSPKQIFHTINNELTVVIGRAALLATETDDLGTRQRCEEIKTAAQKISQLVKEIRDRQISTLA